MSGLNEIIQWTEDNINFEEGEDSQKAFDFISSEFERDNRLSLADILQDDTGKYLEFLEEQTGTSKSDIEFEVLEERLAGLEEEIRGFFNMLGTPIR